jgi:glyoxylase-like metal-dependent hydrolase (beta-lactamase superfamily II)
MQFKVLIEGYAKEIDEKEYATSSCVLILNEDKKIIVDPGTNRDMLLKSLKKDNLTPDDIDYVVLTHNHLDHCLLTGIFVNAKVLDDEFVYSWNGLITEQNNELGDDIEMISTPGHDPFHLSLLLRNTDKGNVVISGDVFWWWDSDEQLTDYDKLLNKEDPYVKDKGQLLNSRKKLLSVADFIIPGHGKAFNNIK